MKKIGIVLGEAREMKKAILLSVMMILLSACATMPIQTAKGWTREETPAQMLIKDYSECIGSLYVKDGATSEESGKDYMFCRDAQTARHERGMYLSRVSGIAGGIVLIASVDLCERCMATKGYKKNSPNDESEIASCMQLKGYEWK